MPSGFIEDKTLSGKTKRRMAGSMAKRQFSVSMHFTLIEYERFVDWFINDCENGAEHFMFPQIDSTGTTNKEYRFKSGSSPSFSNPSGDIIECKMEWEEV